MLFASNLSLSQVEVTDLAVAGGVAGVGAAAALQGIDASDAGQSSRQEKMAAEAQRKALLDSQAEVRADAVV